MPSGLAPLFIAYGFFSPLPHWRHKRGSFTLRRGHDRLNGRDRTAAAISLKAKNKVSSIRRITMTMRPRPGQRYVPTWVIPVENVLLASDERNSHKRERRRAPDRVNWHPPSPSVFFGVGGEQQPRAQHHCNWTLKGSLIETCPPPTRRTLSRSTLLALATM
jgi:hypothetical protein